MVAVVVEVDVELDANMYLDESVEYLTISVDGMESAETDPCCQLVQDIVRVLRRH